MEFQHENWGQSLKAYRLLIGFTQAELGNFFSFSNDLISKWEHSKREPPSGREFHQKLIELFAKYDVFKSCEEVHAFLQLANQNGLTYAEYDRFVKKHVDWPYASPKDSEGKRDKKERKISYDVFKNEVRLTCEFTEIEKITSAKSTLQHVTLFDFFGVQWKDTFALCFALIKVDKLSRAKIQQKAEQFIYLNNLFYKDRSLLKISPLTGWLTYTTSGVLCFVFENKLSTHADAIDQNVEKLNFISDLQRAGDTYESPIDGVKWQKTASSFIWGYDLQANRLFKHLEKQPLRANYHIAKTQDGFLKIEELLQKARSNLLTD